MEVTYTVVTDINKKHIVEKITKTINSIQGILDNQVLKDSNYYCPEYTGTLKKSAIIGTVLGSGRVVWNTPYAHDQYYGFPQKYTKKNINARMKWFEAAKSEKLKSWVKLVNDQYTKRSK